MKKVFIDVMTKDDVDKLVRERMAKELISLYQEFEKLRNRMFDLEKKSKIKIVEEL
jgi:hypothetical protein